MRTPHFPFGAPPRTHITPGVADFGARPKYELAIGYVQSGAHRVDISHLSEAAQYPGQRLCPSDLLLGEVAVDRRRREVSGMQRLA